MEKKLHLEICYVPTGFIWHSTTENYTEAEESDLRISISNATGGQLSKFMIHTTTGETYIPMKIMMKSVVTIIDEFYEN